MSTQENDVYEDLIRELYEQLVLSDVEDYILRDFLDNLREQGLNGLADKLEMEDGFMEDMEDYEEEEE